MYAIIFNEEKRDHKFEGELQISMCGFSEGEKL